MTDRYEGLERRKPEYVKLIPWIVTLVFGAGMFYGWLQSIPDIQKQVVIHETRIALVERDISYIKSGVDRLLGIQNGRHR